MIIPESAASWIMQQRVAAKGDPKSAYSRLLREDYDEMSKWLPPRVGSILDIGCGLAGIDALLHERYGNPMINLLDETGVVPDEKDRAGFKTHGMRPYNDMSVARELLVLNGVKAQNIQEWPIGYSLGPIPCDLCISLLSWGWHYPVSTYLDLAWDSIVEGGRLILDVRANSGGDTTLDTKGFKRIAVIRSGPKGWRLCYKRLPEKGEYRFESKIFS